jgi:hypothetical protein
MNLTAGIMHGLIGVGSTIWVRQYDPQQSISTRLMTPSGYTQQDDWLLIKLILSFIALTSLFHLALHFMKKYRESLLEQENNYIRWLEYGITSSLMLAVISFLVGIETLSTFIMIIVVNLIMILLGHVVEFHLVDKQYDKVLIASIAAWACFVTIWYVELSAFMKVQVPDFVTAVMISMVVLFSLFGFVQLYHILSKAPYKNVDHLYILLSFVSKTTLALLVLGGIMGRN